jgi:hypothetical protein
MLGWPQLSSRQLLGTGHAENAALLLLCTATLHSNGRGADHIENIVLQLLRACMLRALPSNGAVYESVLSNGSIRPKMYYINDQIS